MAELTPEQVEQVKDALSRAGSYVGDSEHLHNLAAGGKPSKLEKLLNDAYVILVEAS